jgi:hypothetical protein
MRKKNTTRFIAAAALVGATGAAVLAPVTMSGAAAVKPPVRVTCTGLFGNSDAVAGGGSQLLSGCAGSGPLAAKAHVTPFGVEVSSGGTIPTAATITWTNKDSTTMGLSNLTGVTNDCPLYLGLTPTIKESVTSTITGGNSKLTVGDSNVNTACVYIVGTQVLIVGGTSTL